MNANRFHINLQHFHMNAYRFHMNPNWNCLKLLHDFLGCQTLLAWFWEFHGKSLLLNYFPDASLFLQVFIRISIQFGGFSQQQQGRSWKNPRKTFNVFTGRTSNFMCEDANIRCKQSFTCASVANKFVLLSDVVSVLDFLISALGLQPCMFLRSRYHYFRHTLRLFICEMYLFIFLVKVPSFWELFLSTNWQWVRTWCSGRSFREICHRVVLKPFLWSFEVRFFSMFCFRVWTYKCRKPSKY